MSPPTRRPSNVGRMKHRARRRRTERQIRRRTKIQAVLHRVRQFFVGATLALAAFSFVTAVSAEDHRSIGAEPGFLGALMLLCVALVSFTEHPNLMNLAKHFSLIGGGYLVLAGAADTHPRAQPCRGVRYDMDCDGYPRRDRSVLCSDNGDIKQDGRK